MITWNSYWISNDIDKIFNDWKHLWTLIQSYLINPENWYDVLNIYYVLCMEYERIKDIPSLCVWLDKLVSLQNEMCITIEAWEYLITFEWTLDAIAMWDDWYYIVDIKTAKAPRTDELLNSRYQCIFYVALWSLVMWISEWVIKFEYWIFIKNKKKGKVQRLRRDIDVEYAQKELYKYLIAFAEKWKLLLDERK